MKWGVSLLTAAIGVLYLLVGFNKIPGNDLITPPGATNWLFVLIGASHIVFLLIILMTSSSRSIDIQMALGGYTFFILLCYIVVCSSAGYRNIIALIISALQALLFLAINPGLLRE